MPRGGRREGAGGRFKWNHGKTKTIRVPIELADEILEYAQYSIEINRNYCEEHGYAFEIVDKNLTPDLPINFSKIQAVLNYLNKGYKYVMHVDADAIFIRKTYPVTNIIEKYFTGLTSFIVSEDCYSKDICSKPGRMNSGIFIVKNNKAGKGIIEKWLSAARGSCKKYTKKFPNCQLVFFHCVRYSIFSIFIKLVPYNLLNGKDGLFIKHYMQHHNNKRRDILKSKLESDQEFQKGNKRLPVF